MPCVLPPTQGGLVGYFLGPKLYSGSSPSTPSSAIVAEAGSLAYQRTVATRHFKFGSRIGVVAHPVLLGALASIVGMAVAPVAMLGEDVRGFFERPPLE